MRDVVKADGQSNGGLMHTGDMDIEAVLNHYNQITTAGNTNLDPRLVPGGVPRDLRPHDDPN
ncbi:MAG: hypothetical protein QNL91_08380 [Candidatus Krumholzibacteria bacterium]|nr:hypothetical protein [Candidatus Krumholzibacteria bacterium]